jgi:uncharacterized membrane protein YeaQ/YmgE (transglycosylase-associated protein family)
MDPFFSEELQAWFELILLWIGFGTCVGLLAKALMPGRDPGGAVATLLMGITGVVIGCGVYTLIYDEKISPITSAGLVCGTMGALVILLFYRVLGGFLLDEAGTLRPPRTRLSAPVNRAVGPRRRRRRRYSYYLDE